MYYAQLDPETRVCRAVTETHSPVSADYMIAVPELDDALLGKYHNAETGEFEAVVQPPSVPQTLAMRQARLALLDAGLTEAVQIAIDALPSPDKEKAQIEWAYSPVVHRHNGLVSLLAPALGLTSEQVDTLFIAGDAL